MCKKTCGAIVSDSDHYRAKALELFARAETQSDPEAKTNFEGLAQAFVRLAEQADRNVLTDVTYEPPLPTLDEPDIKK